MASSYHYMTNQVSVGEGTGSSAAPKSYTTLVIHTIIQTGFPVLQRASQCREVFDTLSFALTANTKQTFPHTSFIYLIISRVFYLLCVLKPGADGN